jgi:hypothetical protein
VYGWAAELRDCFRTRVQAAAAWDHDSAAEGLRFCGLGGYHHSPGDQAVSRNNILYLVVGALVIVAAVLGYQLYQDRKQPEGVRIDVGPNGLKIETK